jgi:hypothetical protein
MSMPKPVNGSWRHGVPAKLGSREGCGWSRAGVAGDRCAEALSDPVSACRAQGEYDTVRADSALIERPEHSGGGYAAGATGSGAHLLLLQVRTRVVNDQLADGFAQLVPRPQPDTGPHAARRLQLFNS